MKHPARDTQLEQIRELGCEIIDQIKPIFDPAFALHPLVLTDTHIAGLRADARYAARDLAGTPFDWITVGDRLGDLWEKSSNEWDGGRQPRKWQTMLDAKSRHLGGLVDNYAKARAAEFRGDSGISIPLRVYHERLHALGVALAKLLPMSETDLAVKIDAYLYDDGYRAGVNVRGFLLDPYYAHYFQVRYSDMQGEKGTWWQWDDFAYVLHSIATEKSVWAGNAPRLRLPPEAWALADELEEVLRSCFTEREWTGFGDEELEAGTAVLGARESDHPSFEAILQGESIKDMADRLTGEWKVFDGEDKLLLRMWAKETKRSQGELKLQLVTAGIIAAAEDCMELHHVKFGRNPREAGGEKVKPWEHFRDAPEEFAHWFKTYALARAVDELRNEGNERISRREKRLLEKEERKRLGLTGRRKPHSHDSVLGKRDRGDPSIEKYRKAIAGSAEMLSCNDEYLGDAPDDNQYHDSRSDHHTPEPTRDPFDVLLGEATFSERQFFEKARELANDLQREPTDDELAEALGKTSEAVRQIKSRARSRHRDALLSGKVLQKERQPLRADLRNRPQRRKPAKEGEHSPECGTCRKVLKKNPSAKILCCPECGRRDPEAYDAAMARYVRPA